MLALPSLAAAARYVLQSMYERRSVYRTRAVRMPERFHGTVLPDSELTLIHGVTSCFPDIDECESKPCDQHCVNLPGSFECQCKTGFTLLEDGTSCRNCQDQFPTEARDLVDVEILAKRVQKLEEKRLRRGEILRVSSEGDNTVMGSGAGSNEMALEAETSGTLAELGRKMETFTQLIQDLKTQLTNVETRQQEQWKLIQKTKSSETIVRRVVPLCKQVSLMQQRMDQCKSLPSKVQKIPHQIGRNNHQYGSFSLT
uniref:EGF-like domain-containing protein n=1 Tax=Timema poppense TaxID=170557 RepID=A0A7R9H1X8_TIMPO|nr:unnamed protein product [Timema poppensis]